MGATTEIKETNIGQALINKECDRCNEKITEKDICEDNNWGVDFDTSNGVKIEDNQIKGYGYNITIWLRNVYHEDCDGAEEAIKEEKKEPSENKGGLYGINIVMENLMESQRRHVEKMKELEKNNKKHGKR